MSVRAGLRVAFLSWRSLEHPQAGGSEVLVDRLACGLAARGHDVGLLCGSPPGVRPYPVVGLGGEFGQYLRAPLAYARHMRRADVLVDVENGVPFFSPLWHRGPVVCLVHHVHTEQWRLRFGPPAAAAGAWLESTLMPAAYRSARFVAVSPSTREALSRLGVDRRRIHLVPNGVAVPQQAAAARSREPLFLALGRLVPHKRLDLLLRVWDRVRAATGGRLVVAGDGPERERLAALAGPGATLVGRISETEKARLLASAWLLVHPALHEGWGIVTMEAAAHATPTLGFHVPGVRDAVLDGRTGVLVHDERSLAAWWSRLAADAALRERLGAAARDRARGFSWERSVDRFAEVLWMAERGAS